MTRVNAIEHLRRQVVGSAAVARLQTATQELVGGSLLFLIRHGEDVIEVHAPGIDPLPEFCKLYRSSPDGLDCCTTCRSHMVFGACYRGPLEYSCHGGVRILATSTRPLAESGPQLVVASCAFAQPDRDEGWREFRDHARGLGIDLRTLRAAYDRMPTLTDDRRRLALSLVEVSAAVMDDLLDRHGPRTAANRETMTDADPPGEPETELRQLMTSALYLSRAQSSATDTGARGRLLAERVRQMVSHNPALPFTLKNVAQAAHVSPNHLSTVFHRFTGIRFSEFLLEQRITLAKRLLRDLPMDIQTVAKRAGFPNSSYFSRRFRMRTGKTPSQWRSAL